MPAHYESARVVAVELSEVARGMGRLSSDS